MMRIDIIHPTQRMRRTHCTIHSAAELYLLERHYQYAYPECQIVITPTRPA